MFVLFSYLKIKELGASITMESIERITREVVVLMGTYVPNLVAALVVLLVGWIVASIVVIYRTSRVHLRRRRVRSRHTGVGFGLKSN